MALAKQRNIKLWFIGILIVWGVVFGLIYYPKIFSYLVNHPEIPIPVAFAIHQAIHFAFFFIIGMLLIRKPISSLRLSLGIVCLAIVWEILAPPLCVSTNGILLITPENPSCRMGNDTFVSWMFSHIGIQYGSGLMYYATYFGGVIIFGLLAVLLLTSKELLNEMIGMFRR